MKLTRIIFCVFFGILITLCTILIGFRYREADFLKTFVTVCIFLGVIFIVYLLLDYIFGNDENKCKNKKIELLKNVQEKLKFPQNSLQEIESTITTKEDPKIISTTKKKNFNYELYKDVIHALVEV